MDKSVTAGAGTFLSIAPLLKRLSTEFIQSIHEVWGKSGLNLFLN